MEALLRALRAAAEPTRLRLLALCARGELSVSELTRILGQSQPRVSRHLKLLVEAGLLDRFQEGTHAFYRLAEQAETSALTAALTASLPEHDETLARDLERLEGIRRARARAAEAYFRKNAPQWDRMRSLYVDEAQVEHALMDMLSGTEVNDLLDVGTGTGRILELLAPRTRRAVGLDRSRDMLAVARANLQKAGLGHCAVRQGDMYQLPWPAGSFDLVTVHQVLHFAETPANAIGEAARVLRPGGRLVIVDFAPHELESLRVEHEHRRLGFDDNEIEGWCARAGLRTDRAVHLPGDPLTVTIWTADRPRQKAPRRAA